MENIHEPLLKHAMLFMYVYYRVKALRPSILPSFCELIPDDEMLIRAMVNKDVLNEFAISLNCKNSEAIYENFSNLLLEIERGFNCSLKEWNDVVAYQ